MMALKRPLTIFLNKYHIDSDILTEALLKLVVHMFSKQCYQWHQSTPTTKVRWRTQVAVIIFHRSRYEHFRPAKFFVKTFQNHL